ncbi:unnamed protein product [Linum tenue]|uniref:F-box domain-containing protein n=1 Tax=Linum tenue TaxID=586396 RepID=A0AAV0RHW1_9ROSI|nr:unnamed protein product [Linum tenue]
MSAGGQPSHGIGGWFPEELHTGILSRLPNSASIARFRCVSKSWRRLLSDDPEFIAKILFSSSSDAGAGNRDAHIMTVRSRYLPTTSYSIAGCAEGILCISRPLSTREIILWNPTTSEAKLLPPKPLLYWFRPEGSHLWLGFDPVTEDYKVLVWLWNYESHKIFVYSLRNDSWRRLCRRGPEWLNCGSGRRVGSTAAGSPTTRRCHWISSGGDGCSQLVSFDAIKETFTELELPSPPRENQERPYVSTEDSFLMGKDDSYLVAVYSGIRRPNSMSSPAGIFLEVWLALNYEALGRKECPWVRLYNVYADDAIPAPAPAPGAPSATGVWEHGGFFVRWMVIDEPGIGRTYIQTENGMGDPMADGKFYLKRVTYRPSTVSLSHFAESKKSLIKRARDTCRSICRTVYVDYSP